MDRAAEILEINTLEQALLDNAIARSRRMLQARQEARTKGQPILPPLPEICSIEGTQGAAPQPGMALSRRDRNPPTYKAALESESIERRMHRILQQTFTRGTDFSARMPRSAMGLAWFLIDILAVDYGYNIVSPGPRDVSVWRGSPHYFEATLRFVQRYRTVPGSTSAPLVVKERPRSAYESLEYDLYRPAKQLRILPNAIDPIVHRWCDNTPPRNGRYTGCLQEVYQELGVDGVAEKIAWDWIHVLRPLERLTHGSGWSPAAHYNCILKTAQQMLPESHPTRSLMEHILLERPDSGAQAASKDLQELLDQGDRWLRTDLSGSKPDTSFKGKLRDFLNGY